MLHERLKAAVLKLFENMILVLHDFKLLTRPFLLETVVITAWFSTGT